MSLRGFDAALVGRDDDLATVRSAFSRAADGEPSTILIGGEAGIGKSRLIRELRNEIGSVAAMHTGWCLDLGAARTPYGPLITVLRSIVSDLGADAALQAVGAGGEALRMLLPELAETPVDRSATSPDALRDAIATLIEAAAGHIPQVIVIEDLHWADASTLILLSFLVRTLTRGRILFLLTYRDEDIRRGDPASRFIADVARAQRVQRLMLARLDAEATRALSEQLRGLPVTDGQLAGLTARAEGVPFFIEELASCLTQTLPDGLRDVLLARFDALDDDDAAHVVRVASASVDGALPHALLTHLVALDDAAFNRAVRIAIDSGIVSVRGNSYVFRHALLREAVYDDLLPGERVRLHWQYAQALEDQVGGCQGDPATLAFHWQRANDPSKALRAAVTAMFQAKASYAYASAARFGDLALELWEQNRDPAGAAGIDHLALLQQLGSILRNAGDDERALSVAESALAEAERTRSAGGEVDVETEARLLRDRGQYLANQVRAGSLDQYLAALAFLDRHGIDRGHLRANVLNGIASRHMLAGRLAQSVAAADDAQRAAAADGDDRERSIAFNLRGCSLMLMGQFTAGQEAFEMASALSAADRSGVQYRLNYSDSLTLRGRFAEAVRVAEEGLRRAQEIGVRNTGNVMTQNMIEPLLALGDIERVERLLATVPHGHLGPHRSGLYLASSRMRALSWRGKIEEAEQVRREWQSPMRAAAITERQVWYYLVEADVAIAVARGDWAEALEAVRRMAADDGPAIANQRRLLLEGGWLVAEARAASVNTDAAARAIRAAWAAQPPALRNSDWETILYAMLDPSRESLEAAKETTSRPDIPVMMTVAVRTELIRVLVAHGERASAASVLVEAERISHDLKHDRLQQAVSALGTATGINAPAGSEESDLTARELQVLELVAEGLSNKQIGERLFISAKTVSVHVSAILRKLGASTRTEAAMVASRR
ncbi:helix-turn-helix transcriptional regulator [Microbacterium sp.]|uniref:helix-turn-helix transcriptional regulator n=1 Tax=Microbacterium sp. TaxID=51671 RepID=UPI0026329E99|nr:helix-turn-helix transcriptional regulator [Microbacterium sp.]